MISLLRPSFARLYCLGIQDTFSFLSKNHISYIYLKKFRATFYHILRSNLDLHVNVFLLLLHCWNQRLGRQEIILKTKHPIFKTFFKFLGEIKRLHQTIKYCNRICGCCLGNTLLYILVFTTFSHPKQKLTFKMGGLGSPLTQVYVPLVQPPEKLIAIFLILVLGL